MKALKIGAGLDLPRNTATQKLAFIGTTGSGKTYGASKLAEQFWHDGAQFVVLDPVGVWYGLRIGKSGKSPSNIDIPVLGGLHGDIPLEPESGALIADLVVDKNISIILDVSQFESDQQKARFAAAFAERFFFRKKSSPSAVHLFIEECQEFVPQNPQRGEEKMLHEFVRMQKLGRNFGIGSSYITQRPQEVNKKALNMAQTLFVFRTTGTHERKAIEQWIQDKSLDQNIAQDLPKLETGTCHVWSPEFLKISETVKILEKETFNASATPEVGKKARTLRLKDIDIPALQETMKATIEKAKADDPVLLKRRIVQLETDLKKQKPAELGPMGVSQWMNYGAKYGYDKFFAEKISKEWIGIVNGANKGVKKLQDALENIASIAGIRNTVPIFGMPVNEHAPAPVADRKPMQVITKNLPKRHTPPGGFSRSDYKNELTCAHGIGHGSGVHGCDGCCDILTDRNGILYDERSVQPASDGIIKKWGPGERATLTAIAQHAQGITREHLTVITGYTKSTRNTYLQRLSQAGLIEQRDDRFFATAAGIEELGSDYKPLPQSGPELVEHVMQSLPIGEAKILRSLIENPAGLEREVLSEITGFTKSSRNTYIQRLGARQLVVADGSIIKAADILL